LKRALSIGSKIEMKIVSPNYTQFPNDILDNISLFSESEFKVLSKIVRNTFGWGRRSDFISTSQICEATGLSNRSVINAVRELENKGMIEVNRRQRKTSEFRMIVHPSCEKSSQELMKIFPESCEKSSQTKESINKDKEKESKAALRALFERINPNYYHDGKQVKSIENLIRRYSLEAIEAAVEKLLRAVASNEKFWRDQPVTPATVLALWDHIAARREDAARSAPLIRARDPFLESLPPEMIDEFVRSQPEVKQIGES